MYIYTLNNLGYNMKETGKGPGLFKLTLSKYHLILNTYLIPRKENKRKGLKKVSRKGINDRLKRGSQRV